MFWSTIQTKILFHVQITLKSQINLKNLMYYDFTFTGIMKSFAKIFQKMIMLNN